MAAADGAPRQRRAAGGAAAGGGGSGASIDAVGDLLRDVDAIVSFADEHWGVLVLVTADVLVGIYLLLSAFVLFSGRAPPNTRWLWLWMFRLSALAAPPLAAYTLEPRLERWVPARLSRGEGVVPPALRRAIGFVRTLRRRGAGGAYQEAVAWWAWRRRYVPPRAANV